MNQWFWTWMDIEKVTLFCKFLYSPCSKKLLSTLTTPLFLVRLMFLFMFSSKWQNFVKLLPHIWYFGTGQNIQNTAVSFNNRFVSSIRQGGWGLTWKKTKHTHTEIWITMAKAKAWRYIDNDIFEGQQIYNID